MLHYRRGLTREEYEKVLRDCIDKVEGLNESKWEEIIAKYKLNITADTLRKAITSPFGAYSLYKHMLDNHITETEQIKQEVGRIDVIKEEMKEEQKKLRQLNNKLAKSVVIAEDIKYYLKQDLKAIKEVPYKRLPTGRGYKMIVLISDWHIGYIIKGYKGNNYNYKIAKDKLGKFIAQIKKSVELYNITEVVVAQLGDIIENTYMRETQQAFECEFSMSEQVSKATKLLYEFITTISEFANVRLISIGGNHSRISSKNANIEGDNVNVIITETIKTLVEVAKNERITVDDIDYIADSHIFSVNGLLVEALHGDKAPKDAKKLYDTEISLLGEKIDLIVRGHFHSFNVNSQNNGAYVITTGSLFGYNPYSERIVRSNSRASQTIVIVGDKEIESIKNVVL